MLVESLLDTQADHSYWYIRQLWSYMALLLVEEFLKGLGKSMLLTKSTLNVVFRIAS